MEGSDRRAGVPPELGVFALVAAASIPLGRLFRAAAPGEPGIGTVQFLSLATSLGVSWLLRRLRIPALLSAVGSAAAFLAFAAIFFHPRTLAGPFPTPHSFRMLFASIDKGLTAVRVEAAPVAPLAGVLILAGLAIWATAWLVEDAAIGLRHPLLGIGLALPMFIMPGTLLRAAHLWLDAGLLCAAALIVLFQDERLRLSRWGGGSVRGWRPGLAVRIGLAAVVLGALTGPLLPGYGRPPGGTLRSGAGAARVTVNPLVSVRPSLRQDPIVDLFRVRAAEPAYWRLTSLDRFNGHTWTATPEQASISLRGEVRRSNPSPVVTRLVQRVEIDGLAPPGIPAAFEPVAVGGIRNVAMRPTSRSLVTGSSFRNGTTFTVISEVPSPSPADLRADAPANPAAASRYTQLPSDTPVEIGQIAGLVTQGAISRLDAAVALQNYLRTFRYDEDVSQQHDFRDLLEFLTVVRAGYCEQFAAAMAVMARSLGIPARVAVGFGPGEEIEPGRYAVTSRQAHAWVEVLFPSFGWLAFEPTPRSDGFDVPGYAQPPNVEPTPGPTATAAPATGSPEPTPGANPQDKEPSGSTQTRRASKPLVAPIVGVAILVAGMMALPGAAWVRRTLRRRRAGTGPAAVCVRYLEFLEWCEAANVGRRPGDTPIEHAERLRDRSKAAAEPAQALAVMATAAVYGGSGGSHDPERAATTARLARKAVMPSIHPGRRMLPAIGWGWWRRDISGRRMRAMARRAASESAQTARP